MSWTGGGLTIKDIIMSHRVREHCLPVCGFAAPSSLVAENPTHPSLAGKA
ncbi:hypothetical protein [Thermincola potens]|nr:hypothetical protein [Thermincola potens]